MIRRHGHYIVESNSGRHSSAYCLKCPHNMRSINGRASRAWVFDMPCRGTWKERLEENQAMFDQAEKTQNLLLKWIAFDQKLQKKAK
jgi:hypothetical protein